MGSHESLQVNPTKIDDFQPVVEQMQFVSVLTRKELSANQCESLANRADSWTVFFPMCPKSNRKPNHKINT